MRVIDISPPIHPGLAVWPGDVPFEQGTTCTIANGASVDLTWIRTTTHLGAHTDAPRHYRDGAEHIAERSLDRYYGPCQVVSVDVGRGERVRAGHVRVPITAPRVLFRTGTQPDADVFNTDFAALSAELVDLVARHHGVLVGIDTPSIDLCDDKVLEAHSAVARHDLAILEGIVLGGVPDGIYTLIALPLRIVGGDASPVRAALVTT
jgi:arylformamidase